MFAFHSNSKVNNTKSFNNTTKGVPLDFRDLHHLKSMVSQSIDDDSHERDVQLRHNLSIKQKSDAQIYSVRVFSYNQFETSTTRTRRMFLRSPTPFSSLDQKADQVQSKQNTFSLEKEEFIIQDAIRNPYDLKEQAQEENFEDIFFPKKAPNTSKMSTSTRSNWSYDCLDDFFMDDLGHCSFPQELVQLDYCQASESKEVKMIEELSEEHNSIIEIPKAPQAQVKEQAEPQNLNCHDQTKNIPKNYIKAIFHFILDNTGYLQRLFLKANLTEENSDIARFLDYIKAQKKTKRYTIQRLKALWLDKSNGKAMRIISSEFLRKRSLSYIFGSKIEKKMHHLKHRSKFISAVENPGQFSSIK